ncbi:zinc-ribbon domain-containing protein, partial [Cupriavidus plantarum]
MAAVKLVTRCPACRTAFRLVADQLRLRQGLVRCGQCETVFDAREHLIEVPASPRSSSSSPSSSSTSPV